MTRAKILAVVTKDSDDKILDTCFYAPGKTGMSEAMELASAVAHGPGVAKCEIYKMVLTSTWTRVRDRRGNLFSEHKRAGS